VSDYSQGIYTLETMTIDSGWVGVMKEESPEAFTALCPFIPQVAYLDGMPLLMAGAQTRKWNDLVNYNFCTAVNRFFRIGARVVVLAFDDYTYVPVAKSITQANRSKNKAVFEFNERQHLETMMPSDYNDRLSNRLYKRRVIDLIVETIADKLNLKLGQTLIIDYVDCPVSFKIDSATKLLVHEYITDMPPQGECDIKFTRWGERYGDMVAHSVDGDFIPISLMECEKQIRDSSLPGFRIALYRMQYNPPKPAVSKKSAKRGIDGTIKNYLTGGSSASAVIPVEKVKKKGKVMEYVNVQLLYNTLRVSMRQCSPSSTNSPLHELHFMRIFACLIGITGTDFTRNTPHLSPKKIWDALAVRGIWPGLIRSYDIVQMGLDPSDACNFLIARLYCNKFDKHAVGVNLPDVLRSLQCSKLGDRIKQQLPSAERVDTTMRNINWVLKYWECIQPIKADAPRTDEERRNGAVWLYDKVYPDPVSTEYGFRKAANRLNAVTWND
jgi:hypothetical protein